MFQKHLKLCFFLQESLQILFFRIQLHVYQGSVSKTFSHKALHLFKKKIQYKTLNYLSN